MGKARRLERRRPNCVGAIVLTNRPEPLTDFSIEPEPALWLLSFVRDVSQNDLGQPDHEFSQAGIFFQ